MKYVMSPPLRDRRNHKPLWDALAMGLIDTVGTDHCPFDSEQKRMGEGDFTKIPNGIPGIEERVSLLYTYGVKRGTLDLHRFVDAASTKAAKIFGLFPGKGTIAIGSDADLVVYDPNYKGVIKANAYEGMEIEGRPETVTVRGHLQVKDAQFIGNLLGKQIWDTRTPGRVFPGESKC
jgi:dihydropyrimidinase